MDFVLHHVLLSLCLSVSVCLSVCLSLSRSSLLVFFRMVGIQFQTWRYSHKSEPSLSFLCVSASKRAGEWERDRGRTSLWTLVRLSHLRKIHSTSEEPRYQAGMVERYPGTLEGTRSVSQWWNGSHCFVCLHFSYIWQLLMSTAHQVSQQCCNTCTIVS